MLYLVGSVLFTTGLVTQVPILSLMAGLAFIFGSFISVLQTLIKKDTGPSKVKRKHYLTTEQFELLRDMKQLDPTVLYIIYE